MIACRFLAVIDSVWSKSSTRDTVAVDTPTALAISLRVTIVRLVASPTLVGLNRQKGRRGAINIYCRSSGANDSVPMATERHATKQQAEAERKGREKGLLLQYGVSRNRDGRNEREEDREVAGIAVGSPGGTGDGGE